MSNVKVTVLRDQLQSALNDTVALAGRVPESARLYQPGEGRPTVLWLCGHLANTMNTIVIRWILDGENVLTKEQSKLFAPDFGGGDPPSTDAAKYPPFEEVVALYEKAMQQVIETMMVLSDEDLEKPIPKPIPDPLRAFFPSIGAALTRMVSHDAYHRGQIGMLSKIAK